jgi:hypothetical protein
MTIGSGLLAVTRPIQPGSTWFSQTLPNPLEFEGPTFL